MQSFCIFTDTHIAKSILKTALAIYIFRFFRLRGRVGPVGPLKGVAAATLVNTVQSETFLSKSGWQTVTFIRYIWQKRLCSLRELPQNQSDDVDEHKSLVL